MKPRFAEYCIAWPGRSQYARQPSVGLHYLIERSFARISHIGVTQKFCRLMHEDEDLHVLPLQLV
jgi:hypothetical protein